jgi:hypothetical protein
MSSLILRGVMRNLKNIVVIRQWHSDWFELETAYKTMQKIAIGSVSLRPALQRGSWKGSSMS